MNTHTLPELLPPDLLLPDEAAEMLRVSKSALFSMVKRGELPFIRLSVRRLRFSREQLLSYISDRSSG